MLVIDDFNELEFLESLLRRLGFDVLSLNKELTVPSAILGFFPDLVMAQAKSRAVDGIALSLKVRKLAPQARMVLLHPIGLPPKAGAELKQTVDAFLELPVDPSKLIAMLAQLGSLDEKVLQEKLNRMAAGKMSDEKRTRLQGKGGQGSEGSTSNMIGGGSGSKSNQSDMVHVTSKNASQPFVPGTKASGGSESATGDAFSKGVHHFQGTNTLKGSTHISGERAQGGAAYDPTGNQASNAGVNANYIPTPGVNRRASASNAEVTERTKKYDQFLASHDEPVDKVIPQGEMRRQAKIFKLDLITNEPELNQKREFVRALFRK